LADLGVRPHQAQLVKQSFAKLGPIAGEAAELFYGRLFEIAPQVRPLFTGDIKAQGRKLMSTIALVVGSLQKMSELLLVIEDLGRRHAQYGVKDEHYDMVAEALLWTLEKGLGSDLTAEVRDAWIAVYTTTADAMKGAVQSSNGKAACTGKMPAAALKR
jgi:hemoglobin-like flavoprotein